MPSRERILWGAGSIRAHRVIWALHELDLAFEHRPIRSRSGETQTPQFAAVNPRRKIPVLRDGDLTLAESAAIVSYLGERYGAKDGRIGLVPEPGTVDKGRYYQWCFFIMTELDAHTLYVLRKHRALVDVYGDAPNALREAEAGFKRQVAVAAATLEDGRRYLLGSRFSGADILLVSCLDWAIGYDQAVPAALSEYRDRLAARPAYLSAKAQNAA